MTIKKQTIFIALSFMLLLSACDDASKKTTQATMAAPPARPVKFITINQEPVSLITELPGKTVAFRIAEIRPQVNGIIVNRLFTEGSEVKQDDQLYQIDDSVYRASYNSARAQLSSAKSLVDRYAPLVNERAISKQTYDNAFSVYQQAQSVLQQAQINLQYTKVLAPISGIIGRSSVTEGALVNAGQQHPLATIQQLDPIYVDITQSTKELLALRKSFANGELVKNDDSSAEVKLMLEDGSEYSQKGKLEFSDISVDSSTGSVVLRAIFPNPEHILLPGMYVHSKLETGTNNQAILIPQNSIARDAKGLPYVNLIDSENKIKTQTIKTDKIIGNKWLVSEGLNTGDRLVIDSFQYIRPGASVVPMEDVN